MCEDRDFTSRARKLGFRLRYEPRARVVHYPLIHRFRNISPKCATTAPGTSQYFRMLGPR